MAYLKTLASRTSSESSRSKRLTQLQKNIQMYGLLTAVPMALVVFAFIVKAIMIIRSAGYMSKMNKTSRQFHFVIAGALLIATMPFILAIINGIYFDLPPEDPYFPLVLDRFTAVGASLGMILLATIFTLAFIRESFLLNIEKKIAKMFQIPFLAIVILTGCPMIVEACLFATKAVHDERYLKIVRFTFLFGSIILISFVIWYVPSISRAMYNLSMDKKRDLRVFQKVSILVMVIITFLLGFIIFVGLILVVDYRSKEYILYMNLAGGFLGLSILPILDHFLIMSSIMIEILHQRNQSPDESGKAKITTNAIPPIHLMLKPLEIESNFNDKDTKIIGDRLL